MLLKKKKKNWLAALNKSYSISLIFILIVAVLAGVYIYYATAGPPTTSQKNCDAELSDQIGAKSFCLQPISVVLSSSNSSEFYIPVLLMKPGSTASISILYHNVSVNSPTFTYVPFTANSKPYALSVATGQLDLSGIAFSNGTQLFKNGTWWIYSYSITAASNASGYYMILPPFYTGFYPALVIGGGPLNYSSLSMWGYTGIIESAEFVLPSTIVGTSNLQLMNVTVPAIADCPNAACIVVTHSRY